eukprot:TRINITY_DN36578_c0_g1_i1.p1 TRINITY_DN36578_c0_g1~~TRINITY_DN36578_c0_g1_i1.p1  ORF type:complete len:960 (-),score=348.16 TRINITY_DN36578_c0_g1_i1:153-3032(-)
MGAAFSTFYHLAEERGRRNDAEPSSGQPDALPEARSEHCLFDFEVVNQLSVNKCGSQKGLKKGFVFVDNNLHHMPQAKQLLQQKIQKRALAAAARARQSTQLKRILAVNKAPATDTDAVGVAKAAAATSQAAARSATTAAATASAAAGRAMQAASAPQRSPSKEAAEKAVEAACAEVTEAAKAVAVAQAKASAAARAAANAAAAATEAMELTCADMVKDVQAQVAAKAAAAQWAAEAPKRAAERSIDAACAEVAEAVKAAAAAQAAAAVAARAAVDASAAAERAVESSCADMAGDVKAKAVAAREAADAPRRQKAAAVERAASAACIDATEAAKAAANAQAAAIAAAAAAAQAATAIGRQAAERTLDGACAEAAAAAKAVASAQAAASEAARAAAEASAAVERAMESACVDIVQDAQRKAASGDRAVQAARADASEAAQAVANAHAAANTALRAAGEASAAATRAKAAAVLESATVSQIAAFLQGLPGAALRKLQEVAPAATQSAAEALEKATVEQLVSFLQGLEPAALEKLREVMGLPASSGDFGMALEGASDAQMIKFLECLEPAALRRLKEAMAAVAAALPAKATAKAASEKAADAAFASAAAEAKAKAAAPQQPKTTSFGPEPRELRPAEHAAAARAPAMGAAGRWVDVSIAQDGSLRKYVLSPSIAQEGHEEGVTPTDGAKVEVDFAWRPFPAGVDVDQEPAIWDGPVPQRVKLVLGDGECCDALESALASMKKGEISILRCGANGRGLPTAWTDEKFGLEPDLKAPAVELHLTLAWCEKEKDVMEMEPTDRVNYAASRKEAASVYFKAARFLPAMHKYKLVAEVLSYMDDIKDLKLQDEARNMKMTSRLNEALCCLKLEDWAGTIRACDDVLKEQSSNEKALYRRASAHHHLGNYSLAEADLSKTLRANPRNKDARQLLEQVKADAREFGNSQKSVYANMMKGIARKKSSIVM